MRKPRTIYFYRTTDAYGEFSNFAAFPIELKNATWPTTEHYFQSQKFAGTPHEEEIRCSASPSEAAKMGRQRRRPLRPDWEAVKDQIMREAVLAKFTQHDGLGTLLLATEDAQIIERTRNDSYWGDGGDGSGLNMLGRILMETRDILRGQTRARPEDPESGLRQVRYIRHEFHHFPEPACGSLLSFVYDVPYLGAGGVFPPFHLLNWVLLRGGTDGGMGPGATWEPFELSRSEYDDLVAAIKEVPAERVQRRSRYAQVQFEFDSSLDDLTDYVQWMSAMRKKHPRK